MKILPNHYTHIKNSIADAITVEDAAKHKQVVIASGKYKDLETRLAHDFAYVANLTAFICEEVYKYADDTHLTTAYKRACKELGLI